MATRNLDATRTVAEWALKHPTVSRVFEKYCIDLCRDSNKTMLEACGERGLEPQQLVEELRGAAQPEFCEIGSDWENASFSELCDHIDGVHHRHLRRELPRLSELLRTVVDTYRAEHPELEELQRCFGRFRSGLERHMSTETTVVLPALRAIERNCLPAGSSSDYLAQLINRLENDHAVVDEELLQMRRLTNGYTLPPNTCAAYSAMLDGFWELEWHLHKAVYEEDEFLFPRARRHGAALLGK